MFFLNQKIRTSAFRLGFSRKEIEEKSNGRFRIDPPRAAQQICANELKK